MPWRPLTTSQHEVNAVLKAFKKKAVFYLDEPVGPAVGEMLGLMGYKVRTAADSGMIRRDDRDHAALCWKRGMILVTHDRDFLSEEIVPEHRNPGVVVLDVPDNGATAAYRAAYFLGAVVGPFGTNWKHAKIVITANGDITVWGRDVDTGRTEKTRYRWLPNRRIEEWVEG